MVNENQMKFQKIESFLGNEECQPYTNQIGKSISLDSLTIIRNTLFFILFFVRKSEKQWST